jgi:hypothetical protein
MLPMDHFGSRSALKNEGGKKVKKEKYVLDFRDHGRQASSIKSF